MRRSAYSKCTFAEFSERVLWGLQGVLGWCAATGFAGLFCDGGSVFLQFIVAWNLV